MTTIITIRENEKQRKKKEREEQYNIDITNQIRAVRQRKFKELVGEMSDRERQWQSQTLKKAGMM